MKVIGDGLKLILTGGYWDDQLEETPSLSLSLYIHVFAYIQIYLYTYVYIDI